MMENRKVTTLTMKIMVATETKKAVMDQAITVKMEATLGVTQIMATVCQQTRMKMEEKPGVMKTLIQLIPTIQTQTMEMETVRMAQKRVTLVPLETTVKRIAPTRTRRH